MIRQRTAQPAAQVSHDDYFSVLACFLESIRDHALSPIFKMGKEKINVVFALNHNISRDDLERWISDECGPILSYKRTPSYLNVETSDTADFLCRGELRHQSIGELLVNIVCLIPVQVARTEAKLLHPLNCSNPVKLEKDIPTTYKKMSLGPLDWLLDVWAGPVKVITIMGFQNSGKSFLLNHIFGTIFWVSGDRCTDGCWMGLCVADGVLYVVLDFEGMGSIQRDPQEDMLMAIFNATFATVALYKATKSLGQPLVPLFDTFKASMSRALQQKGCFGGKFIVVVDSVVEGEEAAVRNNMEREIQNLIAVNGVVETRNCMNSFFCGWAMAPCRPYQSSKYFGSIDQIWACISKTPCTWESGRKFREAFVLQIVKISMSNFDRLERHTIDLRKSIVMEKRLQVLARAETSDGTTISILPEEHVDVQQLCDTIERNGYWELLSSTILHQVPQNLSQQQKHEYVKEELLRICINQKNKLKQWTIDILQQVSDDYKDEIAKFIAEQDDFVDKCFTCLAPCQSTCSSCGHLCMRPSGHAEKHDCGTDHKCRLMCKFCESDPAYFDKLPCARESLHDGDCNCKSRDHRCGQKCALYDVTRCCEQQCTLERNHNGDHSCQQLHKCPEECCASACISMCNVEVTCMEDLNHHVHKCELEKCTHTCSLCVRPCEAGHHLHSTKDNMKQWCKQKGEPFADLPEEHFCSHSHKCPGKCQADGVCYVKTVVTATSTREVKDALGETFELDNRPAQVRHRDDCTILLSPRTMDHPGVKHHCGSSKHICDKMCPFCGNYCNKTLNHQGRHETIHGSIKQGRFAGTQDIMQLSLSDDRNFHVRNLQSAENFYCDQLCRFLGQGHIHTVPCNAASADDCPYSKHASNGKRHDHMRSTNGVLRDEVSHSEFWRSLDWADPIPDQAGIMNKCSTRCFKCKSFCTEQQWHESKKQSDAGGGKTLSIDGHLFSCSCSAQRDCYIILVLDRSGSMSENIMASSSRQDSKLLGIV